MLTHDEMIGIQAEKHELVPLNEFYSIEEFVLHRIHTAAYDHLSELCIDKRVLDLGCNTGYGSSILSMKAEHVTGVDVSENAINVARENYNDVSNIDIHLVDGKRLPFEKNSFDVVVSCQVIEHIVNCKDYLEEVKRVLRPNGYVALTTPNAGIRLDPGMKPWNEFHVREYLPNEFKDTLENYFATVNVYGMFADEPLNDVERKRLENALIRARTAKTDGKYTKYKGLMVSVKALIPSDIKKAIKKVFSYKSQDGSATSRPPINEKTKSIYSECEIVYREKNIEDALDLLAICKL